MTPFALPFGRTLGLVALALVIAAALLLVACAPIASLNALAAGDTYRPTRDVAYGPLPRRRLDVYAPIATAPAAGWPVVVFFYGGSWTSGERGDDRFVGEALAARGVLTLVADYRLHPEARYPAFLEDSARALAQARPAGVLSSRLSGRHPADRLPVYDRVSHALLVGAFGRPLRGLAPVLADVSAWISAT